MLLEPRLNCLCCAMRGWECASCTFVNENPEFLCCGICGRPRKREAIQEAEGPRKTIKLGGLRGEWARLLKPTPAKRRGTLVLERRSGQVRASWSIRSALPPPAPGLDRVWTGRRTLALRLRAEGVSARHEIELVVDADDRSTRWIEPPRYSGHQLLQSHLQKCVRRGLVDLACRTAKELAAAKIEMLLRRLPVILVEDLKAPAAWSTLLVFYCLAKADGYELTAADVGAVLGVVAAAAECPEAPAVPATYRDDFPNHDALSHLARAAYGGMKGDVDMLYRAASRPTDPKDVHAVAPRPPELVARLEQADWLPEGVDFHCASTFFDRMRRLDRAGDLAGLNDNELRSWMWKSRSSLNYRSSRPRPTEASWAPAAHRLADAAARAIIRASAPPLR